MQHKHGLVPNSALALALDNMAGQLAGLLGFSSCFGGFTCSEANSIAEVLALAGHHRAAIMVLCAHAEGDDDPDDSHGHLSVDGVADEDAAARYIEDAFDVPVPSMALLALPAGPTV